MAANLETLMRQELERFQKQREDALAKVEEADREIDAIQSYFAKKSGTPQTETPKRERSPRGKRGSGDSFRDKVLEVIRNNPGLKSNQIDERLQAEGVETKSLGNALSNLVKAGLIQQSAKRQPYFPVQKAGGGEPEPPTEQAA